MTPPQKMAPTTILRCASGDPDLEVGADDAQEPLERYIGSYSDPEFDFGEDDGPLCILVGNGA